MWKVNGQKFDPPSVPTLLKVLSGANSDSDFSPSENSFVIGANEVVEVNISGVNNPHPFHLQCVFVSLSSSPTVSILMFTRLFLFHSLDWVVSDILFRILRSGHTFDVVALNGVINYVNPPRRDTVTTGPGTTTIRFKADNPAPWILHCHMEVCFIPSSLRTRSTFCAEPGTDYDEC
jgi:iron transport multicopper oxidase